MVLHWSSGTSYEFLNYEFYKDMNIFYKSESRNYNHYDMVSMYFPNIFFIHLAVIAVRWYNFTSCNYELYKDFNVFFLQVRIS